jgi:hypothetical protein
VRGDRDADGDERRGHNGQQPDAMLELHTARLTAPPRRVRMSRLLKGG